MNNICFINDVCKGGKLKTICENKWIKFNLIFEVGKFIPYKILSNGNEGTFYKNEVSCLNCLKVLSIKDIIT